MPFLLRCNLVRELLENNHKSPEKILHILHRACNDLRLNVRLGQIL